jgi:predicted transcriptional regulator
MGSRSGRDSILMKKLGREMRLLRRHIDMLKAIRAEEPIGIIRLSEKMRQPQHKIRYSLRILEKDGLIRPSPEGAMTTRKVDIFIDELDGMLKQVTKELKGISRISKR